MIVPESPDFESREPRESLVSAQQRTLELIASGASLADVLTDVCDGIDAQDPHVMATVLLMDPDGERLRPAAGRRVPSGWTRAITPLTIGPHMGSCGTAAFRKEPVITFEIASDPLWSGVPAEEYRDIALIHGLRASWSVPLLSKNQEVLGTFALYYTEARRPTPSDLQLVEKAAHVALIAIELERSHSALREAFAAVAQSEARIRRIIDTIPAQAWRAEPNGTIDYHNQRWHDYTGLSSEEAHAWGWKAVIHPDDLEAAMEKWLGAILPSGQPGEIEARLRRFDGGYRWFLVRVEPLRDEQGQVVHWYGTNTDIDDLKRAQDTLREGEQELRRIVDLIPQIVAVLAPDGKALYTNQLMLDYTGLAADEVTGSDFRRRFFHPEDAERLDDERATALACGLPFESERRARRHDGQYRWFLIRYSPFRDEHGRLLRWYATGTDIDDRKRAEERTRNENLALRDEIDRSSMFEEIVGSSDALQRVLREVAKVARTDSTVLILGETGTGKELIARAIHKKSARAARAFIRVNCAAIPPSLIASELFGHEKGAFTGALQRRLGRFESANGGTIFLDEIGDLPAETQIALLRVTQEREIERVGSNQAVPVDVRILTATNRDLGAAVATGAFRQDLFYRLSVFPIQLPSLRERADDIPLLVEYLIERYAKKAGKKIKSISKNTLALFQAYGWPGNVRELQNVIERGVILCEGDTFSVDETWLTRESSQPTGPSIPVGGTLAERQRAVIESERAMIEAALAASQGRVSGPFGAATKLGTPRQTLDSKIAALGIDKHQFRTR